jgi:signal transduction histidine kinase
MAVAVDGPAAEVATAAETLRSVLVNLLDNVRQHAGPGARATIAWRVLPGAVELSFEDDGGGISEGNAGRVFDRFFTTAREAGGTGLGLPLMRGQLEAAGGAIALARARPGAAFRISLPAAAPRGAHTSPTPAGHRLPG